LDLGAENFLLASTINAILGQRIVRKVCDNCKEQYAPLPQILDEVKNVLGKLFPQTQTDIKFSRGKGCDQCAKSGYLGRIGIFETLPVTPKIASLVLQGADSVAMEKEAIEEGMITMKQDGYMKVLQGITTVEEVLRVAQE
jgi:type II secretory ATPase GspE/PulE/Tfp pilus assembly ATPase PilB-like protein